MPSQQAQGQLYFTFYKKMQYPKHNNLHQPWKQMHCFLSCYDVFIYKKFQYPTLSDTSVSHTSAVYRKLET
jgi:hypothetical protein